jgi:hypothetical protein
MTNDDLRDRLLAMADSDRRVRAELAASGELYAGYAPRMAALHEHNAAQLRAIIAEHGWPGAALVGADGAQAAWLVVQHAIGDPALQRACLTLLEDAAARGDAELRQAALLHDRICFFERRPQRYGTQFDWDEHGQISPWTLEDPEHVDTYRSRVGLEPLAEQLARIRQDADGAPPDFQERQRAMLEWARSVGWL